MGVAVLKEKSFLMLGLSITSKWDWGFYIVAIAMAASTKIVPYYAL